MCLRACVSLCVLLNQPGHPPSGTWLVTSAVTAESPNSGQDKLCPTGETPPVAGGGGAGHSASAQTSELKKLSQVRTAVRSHGSSTHPWGSQEMETTMLMCSLFLLQLLFVELSMCH